jgi:hypothetical protein
MDEATRKNMAEQTGNMNGTNISTVLNEGGFKALILVFYLVIALSVLLYNRLYLYHSLHVSAKHMGLNSPPFIRNIIKFCILIAGIAVFLCAFFLLFRIY